MHANTCHRRFVAFLVTFCNCLFIFGHILNSPHHNHTETNERKTYGQDASGVGKRFVSQTAPAYDNTNHPQYRKPATKVGGTVTRRTDGMPTRRPGAGQGNNNQADPMTRLPSTAPAIAVTGLGGLRAIKANAGARGKPAGRR